MDLRRLSASSPAWPAWARRVELRVALGFSLACMLAWAFAELAGDVAEGDTDAFDRAVLLALRDPDNLADPLGPWWVHEAGRDVTALGGGAVLSLLVASVLGYLWILRERRTGLVLLAGVFGAATFARLLKRVFDRPRPDVVPRLMEVASPSFPSGHATMSAATYLVLGMLLARLYPSARMRAYIVSVAALIALLVGVSRVYLGVHWPTDVLAGWTLGTLWAILVWLAARWLDRRDPAHREARGTAPDLTRPRRSRGS